LPSEEADSSGWFKAQVGILRELIEAQKQRIDHLENVIGELHALYDQIEEINKLKEIVKGLRAEERTEHREEGPRVPEAREQQGYRIQDIIKQKESEVSEHIVTGKRPRILVFGDSQLSVEHLIGIAKSMGIEKEQLDFKLDYEENKRFDFEKIRYCSPYGGILIGPNAHKIVGLGDYSSVIQKLKNEPGFPHVEEIRTHSGELKITKSSFRAALGRLVSYMQSIGLSA